MQFLDKQKFSARIIFMCTSQPQAFLNIKSNEKKYAEWQNKGEAPIHKI